MAGKLPGEEPHSRTFYEALGYKYDCVDIDGTAESLQLDLNYDDVPPENRGQYDLVTNFGTTEHVINQLNAFKIIHDLTAAGGLMIHELPTQGLIDHGLLAYNPKFFRTIGEYNGYETLFFDFRWTEIRAAMPPGLIPEIEGYISTIGRPLFGISEAVMFVTHRKINDAPFIPPLDVPTGPHRQVASWPTATGPRSGPISILSWRTRRKYSMQNALPPPPGSGSSKPTMQEWLKPITQKSQFLKTNFASKKYPAEYAEGYCVASEGT